MNVVVFRLSKKLKELGCKQKSSLYWLTEEADYFENEQIKKGKWTHSKLVCIGIAEAYFRDMYSKELEVTFRTIEIQKYECGDKYQIVKGGCYSAFTIDELGEMLPNDKIIEYAWKFCKDESENMDLYNYIDLLKDPNKLAGCLIYLIENKRMEIPK